MASARSENVIVGVLFRLSVLALGVGGVTAGLFFAAGSLDSKPSAAAPEAQKIGPMMTARDAQPPRPRPVEAVPASTAALPSPPAAALPADRPVAGSPGAQQAVAALPAATAVTPPRPAEAPAPAAVAVAPAPSTPLSEPARPRGAPGADQARPATAVTAFDDPRPAAARPERAQRGALGCTQYKSYDARTGTYRAYDGTVRQCTAPGGN